MSEPARMSEPVPSTAIDALELQVGGLLRIGVTIASTALAVGLALWFALGPRPGIEILLKAGLIVLMLTPLARVVASIVAYVRLREWFFVATTLVVFAVLVAAWIVKS
jgi:uncharacterized membrane protein